MRPSDIAISQEQAKQIARTVVAEVEDYIEQHRSEYVAFLKCEGYSESEVNHDDFKIVENLCGNAERNR